MGKWLQFFISGTVITGLGIVASFYNSQLPVWMEITLSLLLLILLFSSLGIASSDFLCPNLQNVSSTCNISEKLAGMTLLALGNSSPDLFTTYLSMNSGLTTLALGELVGSAFLCLCVVVGLMGILSPFTVVNRAKAKRDFLLDIVFFALFVGISLVFLLDGKLTIVECFIMIILYLTYLGLQIILGDTARKEGSPLIENSPISYGATNGERPLLRKSSSLQDISSYTRSRSQTDLVQDALSLNHSQNLLALPRGAKLSYLDILAISPVALKASRSTDSLALPLHRSVLTGALDSVVESKSVWEILLPFDTDFSSSEDPALAELNVIQQILTQTLVAVNCVPFFWLALTTPCFNGDVELKPLYQAKENLFIVQTISTPFLLAIAAASGYEELAWTVLASVICGCTSYFWIHSKGTTLENSNTLRIICSGLGFLNSIVWIKIFSSVVIAILQRIGSLCGISQSLLGLTLFALGNSIGDLVSNIAFANLGLAMTGLGACFGSPLLYILFGIGMNGAIVILKSGVSLQGALYFEVSHSLMCSSIALLAIVGFYIVAVPYNGWKFDTKIGCVGICWWLIVTGYNVLHEMSS